MSIRAVSTFRPRSDIGRFVEVNVSPAVRMGVEEVTDKILDRAKALCPVGKTGNLKESIKPDVRDTGTTIVGTVGTDLYYGPYVEFGTGIAGAASEGAGPGPYSETWPGMPAQPFIRPALDETRPEAKDIFASNLTIVFK